MREEIRNAIGKLFLTGRVALTDDSGPVQLAQVDLGPTGPDGKPMRLYDQVKVLQQFGFASRPPKLADLFMAFMRGVAGGGVVIASNHQPSRLRNLGEGDSALYDVRGAYVWLKATGLVIDAAGLPVLIQNAAGVTIDAPDVKATGNLRVGNGASGSFTTPTGQTVTVRDGIVTNIF